DLLWTLLGFVLRRAALIGVGAALLAVGFSYGIVRLAGQGRIGGVTPWLIVGGGGAVGSSLVTPPWSGARLLACALIALVPIQFARFSADYFGDYRLRSNS